MAWKKDENATNEVLGLGGVMPDRVRDGSDPVRENTDSVGTAGTAGDVERITGTGSLERTKGATGIDMGAGGNGTDIEP